MAIFSPALQRVKQQLLQRELLQDVPDLCRELGHRWRERQLGPQITVQLMVLQLLCNASLACLVQIAGLSVTPQALCDAGHRLPLQVLMRLVERLCGRATDRESGVLWHGLRVVMADAMHFMVQDTPDLIGRYLRYTGPKPTLGYPTPKLLSLMEWSTGLVRKVIMLPYGRQELCCFCRMLGYLRQGDVILLDRAYGSFVHLSLMMDRGVHACVRLSRCTVTAPWANHRYTRVRRLGRQDHLVRWHRPQRRPDWMSQRRWEQVPRTIELRQIAYRLCRKGFRTHWAWIITTLTDAREYPASDIVALYNRRWQIEVNFRDLKSTLGLRLLRPRSIEQVRKQILCFILLYNLVRLAMLESAREQGTTPDRISFKQTVMWLLWSADPARLGTIGINAGRRRNTQPRRLKNHRKRYNRLNRPRWQLTQPPFVARL